MLIFDIDDQNTKYVSASKAAKLCLRNQILNKSNP
jgi:hypothetical protein